MTTECVICFNYVDVLRILRCGHFFCDACVKELVTNNKITCPTCRQLHQFTANQVSSGVAKLLPKKFVGSLTCTGCNTEKSVESDFVWCNDCCQSLCGMCFLTTHDKNHSFKKWTDGYPVVSNCVAYFEEKLKQINDNEDDTLQKYFDELRLSVKDQFKSLTEPNKETLKNLLTILKTDFPTAKNLDTTKINDSKLPVALQEIEKIAKTSIKFNVSDQKNFITSNAIDDIIGIHRHFCLTTITGCFVKPATTYEMPSFNDFTVVNNNIVLAKRLTGGQFMLTVLNSKWRMPPLYAVFNEISVGRSGNDAIIVLSDLQKTNYFVIDIANACVKENKECNGNYALVESQSGLYGSAKGKIYTDILKPYGDNIIRINNLSQNLSCVDEKKNNDDVVRFLYVDFSNEINIISRSKITREVFEHRKVCFDFLLRKFNLSSDLQLRQSQRITAVCGLDRGNFEDFFVVAVEFFGTTDVGLSSSSLFLYDFHCGTVRLLQNFPELVFEKILVRENCLYCLLDINEKTKKKLTNCRKCLFLFRLI